MRPEEATNPAWYCLRAQLKREHIAAATLASRYGIEVFLPRLRHRKKTQRGPVTFTEALFPGYLFARLVLSEQLTTVRSATGVSGIVHFNQEYLPVPSMAIDELSQLANGNSIIEVQPEYAPGDSVEIIEGTFSGIRGLVQTYLPAKQRVFVLLEFLGREAEVEVSVDAITPDTLHPLVR